MRRRVVAQVAVSVHGSAARRKKIRAARRRVKPSDESGGDKSGGAEAKAPEVEPETDDGDPWDEHGNSRLDFDWIFGEVARECGIPYSEIVKQTPRQTFGHFWRPRTPEETGKPVDDERREPIPADRKPKPGDRNWHPWAPLHQHECWAWHPGDAEPDNPLAIPREIARERHYTQMHEFCRHGMLRDVKGEDGQQFNIEAHELGKLRDACDFVWAKNEEKFRRWCAEHPDEVEKHRNQEK